MNAQAVFNSIFMTVMMLLIIIDAAFMFVSWCNKKWGILIGALCGAMIVILIYGLYVLGNLEA